MTHTTIQQRIANAQKLIGDRSISEARAEVRSILVELQAIITTAYGPKAGGYADALAHAARVLGSLDAVEAMG